MPRDSLDFFLSVQRFVSSFQLPLTKESTRPLWTTLNLRPLASSVLCCLRARGRAQGGRSQGQAGAKEGHEGPRQIAGAENPVIHFLQASRTWCCYCVRRNKSSIKPGVGGDAPYQIGYLSFSRSLRIQSVGVGDAIITSEFAFELCMEAVCV